MALALCVETLDGEPARLTSCVALVGRQPGLSLGAGGEPCWQEEHGPLVRLCVAQDGRLVLLREGGAAAVTVARAGRALDVPPERPVFVLDKDEVRVGQGGWLRLHVHGEAEEIAPPQRVELQGAPSGARRWLLAGAAALALGATAGFGGGGAEPTAPATRPGADASATRPDAGPASRPIEVRDYPPAPPHRPPRGCGGCSQ